MFSYLKLPLQWVLLAAVYYTFARLGLLTALEQVNTSPVWPPTGIAIAACLYYGVRMAPGVFIGAFLVNMHVSLGAIPSSLGVAIGNTLEAIVASQLIIRYACADPFRKLSHVIRFAAIAFFATTISASIGLASLMLTGAVSPHELYKLWLIWWVGDLVGALVFTPLLITWVQIPSFKWQPKRIIELLLIIAAFTSFTLMAFNREHPVSGHTYPVMFIFLPIMVWSVIRYQQYGSTLFILALSTISIYGTLQGNGIFIQQTTTESLLLLQAFIGVLSLVALSLSASDTERRTVTAEIMAIKKGLEKSVISRTEDLKASNLSLSLELEQRKHISAALQGILAATSLKSGDEFYRVTVQNLAETYNAKYAFMGVFSNDEKTTIDTIAVWGKDRWLDNFSYVLKDTPCQDVLNSEVEFIGKNVALRYPDDQMLKDMALESYFGAPLLDASGSAIGILAVMDTKPMVHHNWSKPVIGLFANRLANELVQEPIEQELKLAAGVFADSVEAILIADHQGTILRVNPAFTKITGFQPEEIIGKKPSFWKSGVHSKAFYKELWGSLLNEGYWQGEITNCKNDGTHYTTWQTITTVKDDKGKPYQYISIFSDISEKKQTEEDFYQLAHFDVVTGLPNRTSFHHQLETGIEQASRHNYNLALLFLDIDNFKLVNDTLGHASGDDLLKQIAVRLKQVVRKEDCVSRLGGDEFTIILTDIKNNNDSAHVCKKLLESLSKPIKIQNTELIVTVSIGISTFPMDGNSVSTLLKNADSAMYRAKDRGKNNFQFYTEEMHIIATQRLHMEKAMRSAIENEEFLLHYQPQIDIESGDIVACEALVRWQQADQKNIPPNDFIPVAEDSGLIVPLGEWILTQACRQQKQWIDLGIAPKRIAINLSGRQISGQKIDEVIKNTLHATGLSPSFLELEITESILMEHVEDTIEVLNNLRELGVQLSIDDFGTGYSSMAYLKRFPINKLKIDQSFIRDLTIDNDDAAIVKATIAMGHGLNLSVIAEGVENKDQLRFLRDHGCDEVQGYYLSRPLDSEKITELLTEKTAFCNKI